MSLLSTRFLLFALAMIVVANVLRGRLRNLAYLAGNLAFTWWLLGPVGACSTVAFCLVGYALLLAIDRMSERGFVLCIAVFVACFVYMRDYTLLVWFLPDALRTDLLKTIGLSFILFRTVHVLVEARCGTLGESELVTYLNYNLGFTTIMSGPIQRFQDFREQWEGRREAIPLTLVSHLDAVVRILVGFVKAYVIGTAILPMTLGAQGPVESLSAAQVLIGFYAYYPFLYFNFSGYCDVVIGIGSLVGVRPPENFDKPFLATNISEYWLRVHRSLTLWLTDYVFTPLYKGGLSMQSLGRHPLLVMNLSLFATMLVSGLWHGTTDNFLVFGIVHGLFQVVYRTWDQAIAKRWGKARVREWRKGLLARGIGIVLTFHAAAFAYLFFDLSVPDALAALGILFGGIP